MLLYLSLSERHLRLKLDKLCECAGTGRQARLRGVCCMTYGFKSRHSHFENPFAEVSGFSISLVLSQKNIFKNSKKLLTKRRLYDIILIVELTTAKAKT